MDWDEHIVSIHRVDQGSSICQVDLPGFCKAMRAPGSLEQPDRQDHEASQLSAKPSLPGNC